MTSISISKAAARKISKHRDYLSSTMVDKRGGIVPSLVWSHRTYSTLKNGEVIEHGSRFYLSSVKLDEADQYVVVTLEDGSLVAIRPVQKFNTGIHRIGIVDDRFTLHSRDL
jgi:hypothetical protein